MTDYYQVLEIGYGATIEEIKKAYKNVALKTHPDKNSAPGASEKFKLVVEAANVLKDVRKKAEYDAKNSHIFKINNNKTSYFKTSTHSKQYTPQAHPIPNPVPTNSYFTRFESELETEFFKNRPNGRRYHDQDTNMNNSYERNSSTYTRQQNPNPYSAYSTFPYRSENKENSTKTETNKAASDPEKYKKTYEYVYGESYNKPYNDRPNNNFAYNSRTFPNTQNPKKTSNSNSQNQNQNQSQNQNQKKEFQQPAPNVHPSRTVPHHNPPPRYSPDIKVKPEPSAEYEGSQIPAASVSESHTIDNENEHKIRFRTRSQEAVTTPDVADGHGTADDPIVLDMSSPKKDDLKNGVPQVEITEQSTEETEDLKTSRFEDVAKLFQSGPKARKVAPPAKRNRGLGTRRGASTREPNVSTRSSAAGSGRPNRSEIEDDSEFILVSDEELSENPPKKARPVIIEEVPEELSQKTSTLFPDSEDENLDGPTESEIFNNKKRKSTNFGFDFKATNGNINMNDISDSLNKNVAGNMFDYSGSKKPRVDMEESNNSVNVNEYTNQRADNLSTPVNITLPKVHLPHMNSQNPTSKSNWTDNRSDTNGDRIPQSGRLTAYNLHAAEQILSISLPKPPKPLKALNSETWNKYLLDYKLYKEKFLHYRNQISIYFQTRVQAEKNMKEDMTNDYGSELADHDLEIAKKQYEAMQTYKCTFDVFQQNCIWKSTVESGMN